MEPDIFPTQSDWDELNELLSNETPTDEPGEEDFRANSIKPKEKSPFALNPRSAADLLRMSIPPIKWIVDQMLPIGLSLLVAPSKIGKSWMGLLLLLCVAMGKPFLGHSTNPCGVLYLALEDSWSRLQSRLQKILQGNSVPENYFLATQAPGLDGGLINNLETHLKMHPDTGLIIIDTLQKVRGSSLKSESAYATDYRELSALKKFADDHGICVLVIHHTRKQRDETDRFNDISGTTGIMGVADTVWVISKESRTADEAILSITGRDIIQDELSIHFNKDSYRWEVLGRTKDIAMERAQEEYKASPIVKTIRHLVEQSPDKIWEGTMQEMLDAGEYITQTQIAPNPRKLTSLIDKLDYDLIENDSILHAKDSHGSGGAKHRFWLQEVSDPEDPQLTMEMIE